MLILSVSEAKRQIKDLVEEANLRDQVFYITRYGRPKAVMLSVEHYEGLVQRVDQLQAELARILAAVAVSEDVEEPVMLPAPDGSVRVFRPNRSVSPEALAAIHRAAQLAWQQRQRTPAQVAQDGRQVLERAHQEAIAGGRAIDDEREAAKDD